MDNFGRVIDAAVKLIKTAEGDEHTDALISLQPEFAALSEAVNKMLDQAPTICCYCSFVGTTAEVKDHVLNCEKHPAGIAARGLQRIVNEGGCECLNLASQTLTDMGAK